jgi:hypothetical protein
MGEKLKNIPSPMPHVKSESAIKRRLRFKDDLDIYADCAIPKSGDFGVR